MTPVEWIILLAGAGVLLIMAELALPAHGLLGALAALSLMASAGVAFRVNQYLGLGMFVGMGAMTPVGWMLIVRFWPRTRVGRKVILPPVPAAKSPLEFQIGQRGRALSELKPMGECEFGGVKVEARSESGTISAGAAVMVVSADGRRATVRMIHEGAAA